MAGTRDGGTWVCGHSCRDGTGWGKGVTSQGCNTGRIEKPRCGVWETLQGVPSLPGMLAVLAD